MIKSVCVNGLPTDKQASKQDCKQRVRIKRKSLKMILSLTGTRMERTLEIGNDVEVWFIDFEKAFDG
jgi:hypothetical protein